MDGKLSFNPVTAPAGPIEDANVLRVRWQSEGIPDATANGANPSTTSGELHLRAAPCAAFQAVAAHAAP